MEMYLDRRVLRSRKRLIAQPIKAADVDFVELYEEISRDWLERARALRSRRLAALKARQKDNS